MAGGSSHANAGLMVPSSWLPMAADNGIKQLLEKWQDPEASIYLPAAGGPHLSDWRRLLRAAAEPVQWLKTTAVLHGVGQAQPRAVPGTAVAGSILFLIGLLETFLPNQTEATLDQADLTTDRSPSPIRQSRI